MNISEKKIGEDPYMGKELYRFHEYVIKNELIGDNPPLKEFLNIIWCKYSEEYKGYCEENGYDFENLGDCQWKTLPTTPES